MSTKTTHTKGLAGARSLVFKLLLFTGLATPVSSCTDDDSATVDPSPPTSSYRADVAVAWLNLQLRLVRTTPVVATNTLGRPFGYAGIVGYEAVVPGMPGYKSLAGQLNGLSGLPLAGRSALYSWPLSANAALAAFNRSLFATTSAANLSAIDSLEAATRAIYQVDLPPGVGTRSAEFGQQVAAAVLTWMQTDGHNNATVYTPPTGPGKWVPTAPAFAPSFFPFWGSNRLLVTGSGDNADPGPPPAYSEAAGSPFYLMAREVADISQTLTPDQRAIALFWNDQPNGRTFTPHGHWMSILTQTLANENTTLDKALLAYAKVGISMNEATISCFTTKYTHCLLRPITYIRGPLGNPTWNPLIPTPPHPEYSAGHATVSSAAAEALTQLFGANYAFTDASYVPFGLSARSYTSFEQAGAEAALSRLYGGIHYRNSCEKGLAQGKKVAQNVNTKLDFE
ncbi:vanadium-dependent haloperoxidase [Hymenobacter sp.]|jgi:hypothetical protein|uniref:vanadium-dependent haloperoxidase n=1 Tax=Hymenobacter sp. TaxID=1898978 RepID=UPI002EDB828C